MWIVWNITGNYAATVAFDTKERAQLSYDRAFGPNSRWYKMLIEARVKPDEYEVRELS